MRQHPFTRESSRRSERLVRALTAAPAIWSFADGAGSPGALSDWDVCNGDVPPGENFIFLNIMLEGDFKRYTDALWNVCEAGESFLRIPEFETQRYKTQRLQDARLGQVLRVREAGSLWTLGEDGPVEVAMPLTRAECALVLDPIFRGSLLAKLRRGELPGVGLKSMQISGEGSREELEMVLVALRGWRIGFQPLFLRNFGDLHNYHEIQEKLRDPHFQDARLEAICKAGSSTRVRSEEPSSLYGPGATWEAARRHIVAFFQARSVASMPHKSSKQD